MTIDEPAAAIAAARCLTARTIARRVGDTWTESHPRECSWCDLPLDFLRDAIDGWNAWAGAEDRGHGVVFRRYDAQAFAELSRQHPDEAERQIVAAQGFTEPAEDPLPEASTPPAHQPDPVDEELAAWTS